METPSLLASLDKFVKNPGQTVLGSDIVAVIRGLLETNADSGIKFPNGGNVSAVLQALQDPSDNTLPIKISSTGVFSNPEVFAATAGGSGATQAIDLSKGNICTVSLVNSKANAITISNVTKGVYIIILKQDGTGSCTISSWNGGTAVVWAGGSAPTLTTTASYVDIVTLLYDGTTLRGTSTLNFAS